MTLAKKNNCFCFHVWNPYIYTLGFGGLLIYVNSLVWLILSLQYSTLDSKNNSDVEDYSNLLCSRKCSDGMMYWLVFSQLITGGMVMITCLMCSANGDDENAYEDMIAKNLHNNMQFCKIASTAYCLLFVINVPILAVHFPWYFAVYHACLYALSIHISSVWFWRKYLYRKKNLSIIV